MKNQTWLDQVKEEIVDPAREICDAHHHLWENEGSTYLLHELTADIYTGHRVISTVFVECAAMFNADMPIEFAPVGEVEFVQGIAAMSSSGQYGDCRVAGWLVGFGDLAVGVYV